MVGNVNGLAGRLLPFGVDTLALESSGVYGVCMFERLVQCGLKVRWSSPTSLLESTL